MNDTLPSTDDGTTVATSAWFDGAVRLGIVPGWGILFVTAILLAAFGSDVPRWIQLVPLFASALLLGLPHGAVDHLVAAYVSGDGLSLRTMAAVGTVYAVLGGGYAVVWVLAPTAAFVGFILLTWFHWGQGDVHPLRELLGADHIRGIGGTALTVFVRGGAPMLVPFVAFPDEYRRVATWIVGAVDPTAVSALDPVFTADVRLLAGAGYGILVVLTLVLGRIRAGNRRGWRIDAVETLLLLVFFSVVPPLFAIGLYFCFWHSLRHIVRYLLLDEETATDMSRGAIRSPLRRFTVDALPLTVLALGFGIGFAVVLPGASTDPESLLGIYLVFIAVLTLPHVAFVSILDYEDDIWRS